jgi:hypothetical protein
MTKPDERRRVAKGKHVHGDSCPPCEFCKTSPASCKRYLPFRRPEGIRLHCWKCHHVALLEAFIRTGFESETHNQQRKNDHMPQETTENERNLAATGAVAEALTYAQKKHRPMQSAHEGYAVTLEELGKAWDAIRANDLEKARRYMARVSAMGLRFLVDVTKPIGMETGETK